MARTGLTASKHAVPVNGAKTDIGIGINGNHLMLTPVEYECHHTDNVWLTEQSVAVNE